MKRMYERPVLQELKVDMNTAFLAASHISEGNEGQDGDVKESISWDFTDNESIFQENPFE